MLIADGAVGLWKARRGTSFLGQKASATLWVHTMRKVLDKVSSRHEDEVRELLHEMYH